MLAVMVALVAMTPVCGPARAEFGTTETRGYVDRSGDTQLGGPDRFWDFVKDVLATAYYSAKYGLYEYNERQLETSRITDSYRRQGYDRLTRDGKCCVNAQGAQIGEAVGSNDGYSHSGYENGN
jgi:hypothetical protein